MGKGVQWHNTQFCDLRSTRATRRGRWKPTMNGKKEQYASNPDIDTSRSKYNFHIVKPDGRYYHFIQSRIEQARCRTRKDSTRFVDTLITASPEFFKGKSPKEIAAYFQRAADFLIDRVGRENIVSAMVHMDEKNAPSALGLCAADKGQPPVRQRNYRQPGQSDEVAGRFSRLYGGAVPPTWSVGKAPARRAGSISPPGCSNRRSHPPNRGGGWGGVPPALPR